MFLRLLEPRLTILCLDGLIDRGYLAPELRQTIQTLCPNQVVAVTYRDKREAEEWLTLNPLSVRIAQIISRRGAWAPPPIQEALALTCLDSAYAFAICTDSLEVAHAHAVGVGNVLLADPNQYPLPHKPPFVTGPDYILLPGADGTTLFSTKPGYGGYVAEVIAAYNIVPRIISMRPVIAGTLVFENHEAPDSPIHICGRYFRHLDPRHRLHPLSLRLLNAKRNPERQTQLCTAILKFWVDVIKPGKALMTGVPGRPGQPPSLVRLSLDEFSHDDVTSDAGLLECIRSYPEQKVAGGYAARRDNVRGAFRAQRDLTGMTVILVDDITTSFSTLNEGRLALMERGAQRVIPVALSFHPENVGGDLLVDLPKCAVCKNAMRILYNRKSGEPFLGCSSQTAIQRKERHSTMSFRGFYVNSLAKSTE